jgi:acetolactate synthase small subunit
MSEKGGLDGIWEDLNQFLSVNVDTYEEETNEAELPIVIKFVLANTAPNYDQKGIEIVYEGIELAVGIPPDFHIEGNISLKSGESFTYEHRCQYSDFPKTQYSVKAKVNPALLLQIVKPAFKIPGPSSRRGSHLSIKAYLEAVKETNIYRWQTNVINALSVPGPDTTLSQIKAEQDKLSNAITEIRETEQNLQGIYGFLAKTDNVIQLHQKLIGEYLKQTERGCAELRQLLDTHNTRTIEATRNNIVHRLSEQASRVEDAIKALESEHFSNPIG